MDHEPGRDASEAEAVRLYLDAIEVPPVPWARIEARARRLRARRQRFDELGPVAAAVVAAATLLIVGGQALAPVRRLASPPATAYSSVRLGPAASHGPTSPSATATAAQATGHSAPGPAVAAPVPAALGVPPVRYATRTYQVEGASLPAAALGRLLAGQPTAGATSLPPPPAASRRGRGFDVLAVYAVRGVPVAQEIAVLGRFGHSAPSLWPARAVASSHDPHA